MATEQIRAAAGEQLALDQALALAAFDRELEAAERAYQKALRNPRGDGLAEAGAQLQRLYTRLRQRTAR